MSLNGLDDPSIIESYQSALAEAGGWFLLKYVSRDVVALLHKGTGGVVEIRSTISAYEEKSPLYGFLQYRRRKIILRYVPEGISRLIQGIFDFILGGFVLAAARITVQFQSILDRFSPHDTVFSLTTPSELTENALSSTCLLHTASGSMTSSTSSLRQRRLGEITEDAEENGSDEEEQSKPAPTSSSHSRAESVFSGTSEATAVPNHHMLRDGGSKPRTSSILLSSEAASAKPLPPVPNLPTASRANGIPQQHLLDQLSQPLAESRKSSQSVRPSLRDLDQISIHRPKVRLGPRPSMDANGRPKTAGSMTRSYEPRPVASLPAGMRSRKQSTSRPKSQPDYDQANPQSSGTTPPVPPLLVPPPMIIGAFSRHAPPSPRSIRSCATTIGMTPEKQRLMRALELRKQQMSRQPKKAEQKTPEPLPEAKGQKDKGDIPNQIVTKEGSATVVGPTIDQDAANKPQLSQTAVSESRKNTTSPEMAEPVQTPSSEASTPDSAVELSPSHPSTAFEQKKAYGRTAAEKEADPEPTPPQTPPEELELLKPVAYSAPKMADVKPASQLDQMAETEQSGAVEQPNPPSQPTPIVPQDSPESSLSSSITSRSIEKSSVATSSTSTLRNVSDTESDVLSKHTIYANSSQSSITDELPDVVKESEPEQPQVTATSTEKAELSPPQVAVPSDSDSELGPDTPTPRDVTNGASEIKDEACVDVSPAGVPSPIIQVENSVVDVENNEASIENLELGEDSKTVGQSDVEDSAVTRKKDKRIAMLDPLQIPTNANNSEEDILLSDDSFMDELGSATLQEARPIAIPRTPTTSNGEKGPSVDRWNGSRMVSNSSARSDIEALPVGVASSRAFFESEKSAPVLVAKKVNVSSGISKRIKALEMFSSREAGPIPDKAPSRPEPPKTASPSAFEKFRKRTSISQSPGSLSPSPSNLALPQLGDAAKHNDPKQVNGVTRPKSKSVSVTARIVRGATGAPSEHSDQLDPNSLNLQRSEITVEQGGEKGLQSSSLGIRSADKRHSICSSTGSKRNSYSGPKSPPSDAIGSRLSISSRPKFDSSHSHSSSDAAHYNVDNVEETKEDKKGSRKSRIIRRMSSITTNSRRKSTAKDQKTSSASIQPPKIDEASATGSAQPPIHVVDVGEVNVQFPDTLLWKRRFMRVDEAGYLILTPGTIDGNPRNTVKRYHLSEFRRPYVPDHDRQELPNSILLDFCDGNTLQCACESKQGQSTTLQTLIEAHHNYTQ
ncbi:ankyrin repeat protein [Arthroderma uncinatum]|uniref:ankyrin repeat protein n=1 Tax=Arthroderma uncinatum TaxID=74035 RepID=UPI00144AEC5A|nr:ankyrin repeat protein [Arthroderma uncinatum]KAF3483457.1 ankyrin repeat protein [Arthroderma uncinatum]